jgi:hypothetical protein
LARRVVSAIARQNPPGLWYLLQEILGIRSHRNRFVYVTDGGDDDQLGLVELLRRGCDWIWCIDASGDAIDAFTGLGHALAVAEAELGVLVDIQPDRDMAPELGSRFVRRPFCTGTISYPPFGTGSKVAKLIVIKAGVPADAPWATLAYHAANPQFPNDPSIDQIYTPDRFDAYVSLGRFSMSAAYAKHAREYEDLWSRSRSADSRR